MKCVWHEKTMRIRVSGKEKSSYFRALHSTLGLIHWRVEKASIASWCCFHCTSSKKSGCNRKIGHAVSITFQNLKIWDLMPDGDSSLQAHWNKSSFVEIHFSIVEPSILKINLTTELRQTRFVPLHGEAVRTFARLGTWEGKKISLGGSCWMLYFQN